MATQATPAYCVWRPHYRRRYDPDPAVLPGVTPPARFIANALGLRGDEMPSGPAYRVLTFGGSSVECLYLDQEKAWPQLLQSRLNARGRQPRAWVGNASRRGITTRHYLLQMTRLLPQYPPIEAIVLMIGVNDLILRLAEDTAYDPRFLDRPDAERSLAAVFSVCPRLPGDHRPAWRRLLHPLRRSLISWRATGYFEVPDRRGRFYLAPRRRRKHAGRRTAPPDLTSALEEYARNVRAMIAVGRRHHTRLIFATHPAMWRPGLAPELEDLLWVGGVGPFMRETEFYTVEVMASVLERYNRTLLATCREQGVECVDLASRLAPDANVFYDDVHFNERGAAQVARLLDDYLAASPSG